jgi:hypothetical protein
VKKLVQIKREADIKGNIPTESDFPYEFKIRYNAGPPPGCNLVEDYILLNSKFVDLGKTELGEIKSFNENTNSLSMWVFSLVTLHSTEFSIYRMANGYVKKEVIIIEREIDLLNTYFNFINKNIFNRKLQQLKNWVTEPITYRCFVDDISTEAIIVSVTKHDGYDTLKIVFDEKSLMGNDQEIDTYELQAFYDTNEHDYYFPFSKESGKIYTSNKILVNNVEIDWFKYSKYDTPLFDLNHNYIKTIEIDLSEHKFPNLGIGNNSVIVPNWQVKTDSDKSGLTSAIQYFVEGRINLISELKAKETMRI